MRKSTSDILLVLGLCLLMTMQSCLVPEKGQPERVPVPPTSMFFEQTHYFCSDRIKDRFLVGYFGESLLDTTVYFYVINHMGDTIYRDDWPARTHLDGWEDAGSADSVQVRYIQDRMRELVKGQTGLTLPVNPDSVTAVPDFAGYFRYQVGNHHKRTIVYSKSEKAVVIL